MESRALTRNECKAIISGTDNLRNKCLAVALVNMGFRISELLQISIGDVARINKGHVVVIGQTVTVTKENLKGGKNKVKDRTVRLNSDVRNVLKQYVTKLIDEGKQLVNPLFGGRNRGGLKAITARHALRIFKAMAEIALGTSQNISTHSGRKSFANFLYQRSEHNLMLVSAALGHKSILTTSLYLKSAAAMGDELEGLI